MSRAKSELSEIAHVAWAAHTVAFPLPLLEAAAGDTERVAAVRVRSCRCFHEAQGDVVRVGAGGRKGAQEDVAGSMVVAGPTCCGKVQTGDG